MLKPTHKILQSFSLVATSLALAILSQPAAAEGQLNIYNWGDYINPDVLTRFTEEVTCVTSPAKIPGAPENCSVLNWLSMGPRPQSGIESQFDQARHLQRLFVPRLTTAHRPAPQLTHLCRYEIIRYPKGGSRARP